MRRLLHLLWILPLLGVLVGGVAALSADRTLERHRAYHDSLPRSLEVASEAFPSGGRIPTEHTCQGRGIAPPVEWSGAPEDTRSFALVETDWDVPAPWLRLFHVPHWVLYDIPPDVRRIPEAARATELRERGITVGTAMGDTEGYFPSCPPLGRHAYEFHVYALDVPELEPASPARSDVMEAIRGHVLAYGRLVGMRTRE